jgi:haloalkane dehalogenase
LIRAASTHGYRALALDNLGCGLSDKPQDWPYHLEGHVRNTEEWLSSLKIRDFVLVCHDWGGGIGMGVAVRHPEWIRRIVLMNTAAFLSRDCPPSIYLCRCPGVGAMLVRGMNLFIRASLKWAVAKPLPKDVKDGYLYPYGNWHDRIATLRFVQDIPLTGRHPTYPTLKALGEELPLLHDKPVKLLWGEKDFCLHLGFYEIWRKIYPHATAQTFPNAGHYLLEDAGAEIIPRILES